MICLMFFHSIGSLKKSDPFLTELERLILTLQLVHKFLFLNLQRTHVFFYKQISHYLRNSLVVLNKV